MAEFDGFRPSRPSSGLGDRPAPSASSMANNPRIERALNVQEFVARHPVVDSASIASGSGGALVIKARLSTLSYKTRSKTYYTQSYFVSEQDGELQIVESSMEAVSEDVKMTAEHHTGKWKVSFKVVTVKEKKKCIIELRDQDNDIYDELDVTNIHADFLTGEHWGRPTWLEDERILVYVAEQHTPNWNDEDEPYTAYTYAPNFGEQLSRQTRPGLFLLDFTCSEDITVKPICAQVHDEVPETTMFRQPALAHGKDMNGEITVFATGSSLLPDGRRLGSIYCYNRPDSIHQISINVAAEALETSVKRISSLDRSARYARVIQSADGQKLVYVSNRRGFEHNSCAVLHKRTLPISPHQLAEDDILVDIVGAPSYRGGFPGLYPEEPPSQCILTTPDSSSRRARSFIVLATAWASRTTIILVDPESGSVHDVGSDDITSYKLLSTDNATRVIAIRTSTIYPPELVLGTMDTTSEPTLSWKVVKRWPYRFQQGKHFSGIDTLYSTIVSLPDQEAAEAILITGYPLDGLEGLPGQVYKKSIPGLQSANASFSARAPPLIICPHGGPNSQYFASWNLGSSLAWIAAGYSVAYINYPGSTGFGQSTIEELSKDCGNLEVRACLELKDYLIKLGVATDAKGQRLYLGGSHSGFIGAHLSVRWPDAFDAVDLRNPVIDLPSMFATSDIPDWTLSQLNLGYDYDKPPAFVPEALQSELHKRSPSYHAQKLFAENEKPCVTPTQLQLGANDLRVPSNQGKAWYHCLKGHGEDVRMLSFPDNGHPLEQIWAQRKSLAAQLEFLVKYSKFD